MRNFCKKAALIAGIMGSAGAVCAQPINPFYRLFPAEVFTSSIEEDVFDDGVRRYAGITAHGKEMDIGIDRLELGTIPGGNLTLEIGGMTIRPRDTAAPAISMTGISIQLRDWPDIQGADGACAWLEQVHSLDIKAAEMRLPSEPAGVTSLRAQGLGFAAQGRAGGCWLEGLLSLASLDVYRGDGSSVALTQLRGEVAAPGSRQTAQSNAAPSGLEVDIAEIELRNASRGPAYAVSDVAIDAALETSSLEGLLHVLRNSRFFGAEAKPELNIMQLTNAFTLLEGQLALEAPITRIYSAGVVPPEAVTNFSKVGLSTITGETSLEVAADRGAFSAQASAAFIGLVDLEGQIAMDLAPYARQKLLAAPGWQEARGASHTGSSHQRGKTHLSGSRLGKLCAGPHRRADRPLHPGIWPAAGERPEGRDC